MIYLLVYLGGVALSLVFGAYRMAVGHDLALAASVGYANDTWDSDWARKYHARNKYHVWLGQMLALSVALAATWPLGALLFIGWSRGRQKAGTLRATRERAELAEAEIAAIKKREGWA